MALISVVIPVYKAQDCLQELCDRLRKSLTSVTNDYEIVLVEDCGGDRSWKMIQELSKGDPKIKGIKFSRNFGQHYGITAGLEHCNGDWVVVMDCDLQDRPEEIPRLYAKALEGHEIVLARRGKRKDRFLKRFTSRLFYIVFSYLSEIQFDGQVGNFRIISRRVVLNYRSMKEQLRFFGGIINWLGFSTASIEVQHDPSLHGKTTYTYRKLFKLATETILAYTDKPLRMSIKFGFTMSFVSMIFGIYFFLRSLIKHSPVLGWSSLMVSLYFLGGIIIAILGIIGLYLGKTFDETKKRPLYVIESTTFNE